MLNDPSSSAHRFFLIISFNNFFVVTNSRKLWSWSPCWSGRIIPFPVACLIIQEPKYSLFPKLKSASTKNISLYLSIFMFPKKKQYHLLTFGTPCERSPLLEYHMCQHCVNFRYLIAWRCGLPVGKMKTRYR